MTFLLSLATRLKNRALLELDLADWRRQTASLRRKVPPTTTKVALFCDLMAMVGTIKSEAVYAAMLRDMGYRCIALFPSRYSLYQRLFQATGQTDFIFLEDYLSNTDMASITSRAQALVDTATSLTDLFSYEESGYRIGRNALSAAIRRLRAGKLETDLPRHRAEVAARLADSMATRIAADKIIQDLCPNVAIFNERGYTPAGEVFDACLLHGVDTVQWVGAPQAECLIYKRYDLKTRDRHPLSLSGETWHHLRQSPFGPLEQSHIMAYLASNYKNGAWFNRQQLQDGKTILDREETRQRLKVQEDRKVAVIFAHILYDATFFYGSSLFPDYESWLIETVRSAIQNTAIDWIVKVHPVNVWRSKSDGAPMEQLEVIALRREFGELPEHVRILPADTDINTYSLFSAIDYGLTVRGTIGMELPCYGIPTVTAGSGRYSGEGFTIDPPSQDIYRNTLARLHEIPRLSEDTINLARRYAYGTFLRRPIPMESFLLKFGANTFGLAALSVNTRLDRSVCETGEFRADGALFVEWIESGDRHDILNAKPLLQS